MASSLYEGSCFFINNGSRFPFESELERTRVRDWYLGHTTLGVVHIRNETYFRAEIGFWAILGSRYIKGPKITLRDETYFRPETGFGLFYALAI